MLSELGAVVELLVPVFVVVVLPGALDEVVVVLAELEVETGTRLINDVTFQLAAKLVMSVWLLAGQLVQWAVL